MEQSNIGFCHFEPSLTGFVNEMECQVSGDATQRPANIAGSAGGLAQQTLNTIFENSDFNNENHFDHHHHHPNFPVTSTQFFMSGEMFGMSSSSNSSVFNFPAPSFLSQADLSRVYPFIQRGTAMQGLLSSTMDPHHHHHHHHHPHLPHQLTHSIFPMHRFPDLLNANPEVLPALNFHSDIRGSAPFFKPSVQFSVQSVHQQQQNILKLPTLPATCAPNIINNSPTPSSSTSSTLPTSSMQNAMPQKPVEASPSSSSSSALVPARIRGIEETNVPSNMSSTMLKFSEGSKVFQNDFLAFQKSHQISEHPSNHARMALAPAVPEASKLNNPHHFQPQVLDSGLNSSNMPPEDDSAKSRKSNKSSKHKHHRTNNNANVCNNNNTTLTDACMNQMLASQVQPGGADLKNQVEYDEGDKNVDIVNTILQLVNDEKPEEIDQPEHLPGISGSSDGDGTKDADRQFFEGRLQDSNSNPDGQQQLHSMIPGQSGVSIKVDSLVQVEESQCIMVDNQKRWKCSQCPKMYSTKHNLITHMLGHKGIKPHFCSLCGKYFKQVSHLHTHMLTHGKIKPHTCPVCFRSFTQSCHVKRHMVVHQQDKTHACNICGRNFAYPNDLKKHLQKHEDSKTPKGTDVDDDDDVEEARQAAKSSKRQLLKLHAIQNGLKCEQCQMTFESKDKLLNHRALEHRDTYACAECDKVFAYPSQLKHHASKHNNIRPFICRECGENFMKEHHLKAHMFTHTGLKPYDCTTCGRAFNQKANLRRHTLIHEAQKKFSCDVCGKMFTQLQILRAHLITHREQKPFQCKICDKRFSRLHNLNGHMHLHGGERPYVCSCGSSFTLKGNLNRHKKDKNCQPIEMIELDEIDTKPIFDAIAVDTVAMETDKGATSSGEDRKDGGDGSKKKRKSVPRKTVTRDAGGSSDDKKEEENDSSTWQEKRGDEDFEEEDDNENEDEGMKACTDQRQQPNEYIELLTVKEYLFDKGDDQEEGKFNPSNFPFQGMYNHEQSADQSMQFLSFASESTNCSAANRDESDRADGDESADKEMSTTDDEYDYDESSLMADEKPPHMNLS